MRHFGNRVCDHMTEIAVTRPQVHSSNRSQTLAVSLRARRRDTENSIVISIADRLLSWWDSFTNRVICARRANPTSGRYEPTVFRSRETRKGKNWFLSEWHLFCTHADNQAERHQKRPPFESNNLRCLQVATMWLLETMIGSYITLQGRSWNIENTRRHHLQGVLHFVLPKFRKQIMDDPHKALPK